VNLLIQGAGMFGAFLIAGGAVVAYKATSAVQFGYPGTGMQVLDTNVRLEAKAKANVVPPALPPASTDGPRAVDAYKNVQVLGHLSAGEVTRLMTAMTLWVAPVQGCAYCHAPQRDAQGNVVKDEDGNPQADNNNMHSDELYPKRVARRMLQMTMRINSEWKTHVKATGVTCFTCHRGNPVPANIWFDQPQQEMTGLLGNRADQNAPSTIAGLTSLPGAPLRPYLAGEENIRVQATVPVGSPNRSSIKQTEWTYSLMIHMSNALGVNCTFCHNSRSMGEWNTSPQTRATAWYGIRMVREVNRDFLEPLLGTFPPARLGPLGDVPKANCATCHQGAYRPLLGASMLGEYQVLAEAKPQPVKQAEAPAAAAEPTAATADGGAGTAADAGTPVDGGPATRADGGSADAGARPAPKRP
jgi:photosynthetic reaction center cytochrome c subunit